MRLLPHFVGVVSIHTFPLLICCLLPMEVVRWLLASGHVVWACERSAVPARIVSDRLRELAPSSGLKKLGSGYILPSTYSPRSREL